MENSMKNETTKDNSEKELNELKESIVNRIEKKKCCKKIDFGNIAITFVLIVMIAVSAIQTSELINIMNKINNGAVKSSNAAVGASVPAASSVDELPDMVGGC
jgi:hypothetical protein